MDDGLVFTVLGARGSWPISEREMMVHGGRTTSFMIALENDVTVIVDAGTGISAIDDSDRAAPQAYHVFLTHYHLDHVQGLQFFKPLYRADNSVTFYGVPPENMKLEEAVGGIFRAPWFPISLAATPSQKRFVDLDFEDLEIGPLRITTGELTHPQGATSYRIEGPRATVVIATDHEAGDSTIDASLVEFARGADYLFHDAQYTPEEHDQFYEGWGHSTWEDASDIATRAEVGQLVLTSHDPSRTDAAVAHLTEQAAHLFPTTVAAYEGMQLPI
ncbi:MAG: MBL fold metallo-hydrolase [bacterium]|nr:MBL fold metallo-hydrolase [bacterium]